MPKRDTHPLMILITTTREFQKTYNRNRNSNNNNNKLPLPLLLRLNPLQLPLGETLLRQLVVKNQSICLRLLLRRVPRKVPMGHAPEVQPAKDFRISTSFGITHISSNFAS